MALAGKKLHYDDVTAAVFVFLGTDVVLLLAGNQVNELPPHVYNINFLPSTWCLSSTLYLSYMMADLTDRDLPPLCCTITHSPAEVSSRPILTEQDNLHYMNLEPTTKHPL